MNIEEEIEAGRVFLEADENVRDFNLIGTALYSSLAKDVDFIVEVADVQTYNPGAGWTTMDTIEGYDVDTWTSWRKGNLNLIVTSDSTVFTNSSTAAHVCAVLGLNDKVQRVMVFRVMVEGYDYDDALAMPIPERVNR